MTLNLKIQRALLLTMDIANAGLATIRIGVIFFLSRIQYKIAIIKPAVNLDYENIFHVIIS